MKIAKRDLALIMVIVGILAAFCSYKFYFSGTLEKIEQEEATQADLQARIDEVQARAAMEQQYNAEMEQWAKDIDKVLAKYDVAYRYEDGILYLNKIEKDEIATIPSYTVGETNIISAIEGQGNFAGKAYVKGTTVYSFAYRVESYEALKTFIDYIVSGKGGVKSLDTMSFVQDTDGSFSGNVTMTVYVMSDGSKEYKAPVIKDIEQGNVENIWGAAPAAPSPTPTPEPEPENPDEGGATEN